MESNQGNPENSFKGYNFPHSEKKKWREQKKPNLQKIAEAKTINEMLPSFKELVSGYFGQEVEPQGIEQFSKNNKEFLENQQIDLVKLLNEVAKIALQVEELFPLNSKVRLIQTGSSGVITLTSKQCLCLVCHMFFCTLIRQPEREMNDYSFAYWISTPEIAVKLIFVFNYFNQALKETEMRNFTMYKENFAPIPKNVEDFCKGVHNSDEKNMTNITIEETKKIEDFEGPCSIMTDFANEFIGGDAANFGNVQEEILFAIYPELFVSQLFLERMDPHEAIYMKGAKKYSDYKGYGESLDFKVLDQSKRTIILDSMQRIQCVFTAIDASINYSNLRGQLQEEILTRDLVKAYVGFRGVSGDPHFEDLKSYIVTGNWGCGMFGGKPEIKIVIQWIAASLSGRNIVYTTFGNKEFQTNLEESGFIQAITKAPVTKVLDALLSTCQLDKKKELNELSFFDHIIQNVKK